MDAASKISVDAAVAAVGSELVSQQKKKIKMTTKDFPAGLSRLWQEVG